ncbi:hypothetical protein [Azospirillum thermophilum]|uniref:hypothetical protein n=1 Tax=Azospirillum thermophilum TaxID=2202148 RepID=UPI0026C5096B
MTHVLQRLSIRATLGLVIAALGLLLISTSTYSLFDVVERTRSAGTVATLSETSRDLLRTLLAVRLERGVLTPALGADQPVKDTDVAEIAAQRRVSEAGYGTIVATLQTLEMPGLRGAADRLRAAHDALVAARRNADEAARQPKAARNPAVAEEWSKAPVAFLDALTAATDLLDSSLKLVDPVVDHLLSVKRAAWNTRLAAGGMALRIQTAVATGQPWTQADALAVADLVGRAAQSWALVTEAASRADTPATIREAADKAKVNFEGPRVDQRKAILAALAEGRRPPVEIAALRQQDTASQGYIVDTAHAAVDQMVERAQDRLDHATRDAIVAGILVVAAIVLTVAGLIVTKRRVTGPIQAMTEAMRRLAERETTVEIPGRGRGTRSAAWPPPSPSSATA